MPNCQNPTITSHVRHAVACHRFTDPSEWAEALGELAELDDKDIEHLLDPEPQPLTTQQIDAVLARVGRPRLWSWCVSDAQVARDLELLAWAWSKQGEK